MVTDCSNGSDSLKVQLGIMGVCIALQYPEGALSLNRQTTTNTSVP
jgi:hypothetical protein